MKVITYTAPNRGGSVNLTRAQVAKLQAAGKWPKNSWGDEYCHVSHGLHMGRPSYSDDEISRLITR